MDVETSEMSRRTWTAFPGAVYFRAMARFLVTYHGGGAPQGDAEKQQAMADFMAWAQRVGPSLVDPGAPLGSSQLVSPGAVSDGPADGPAAGYSIVEAENLSTAVALVRNHPFVGRGGSLLVSEAVSPD